ncbi:MFS transporter, SP family, solute carrier family 2, member 1 [Paragonimus westermani]|uniref:MFS transporter, SP family, solute carrier family 2, member 1 n=1 Tax=Paragonimus westermani TaxID=34504 RepID=A0A5J4N7Y6_9TREM|nr:MFS transporter, SP family, solute carrier family 2, member 1 [Paragonimus westermani]
MISLRLSLALFTISITTSFQFGYHTGVINAPQLLISEFIKNVTRDRYGSVDDAYVTTITSLCVSSFLFGGMVGALLSGLLANKFGRKKSILLLSGPCAVGSVMVMVSQSVKSFEIIIIGRALIGFACGAYTGIGPTYMTEMAPCSIRGAAAVLNQLVIVTSLVVSQIFGLRELMGTERLWPYLLGLNLIPCVFGFLCLLLCPESPRYLYLVKNDRLTAREALQRLRNFSDEIEIDLESYEKESELKTEKAAVCDLWKVHHLRLGLLVAVVAQMGQQLSGINGILYYSVKLFKASGLTDEQATYNTIGLGGVLLLVTIISIFIIDRVGRRVLLIGGLTDAFFCLIVFTVSMVGKQLGNVNWPIYPAIISVYLFICGFAIGPGSIPWFIVAEMFSQENRDAAVSVAITVNWLCNIAVGLGFIQMIVSSLSMLCLLTGSPLVVDFHAMLILLKFALVFCASG